MSRPQSKRSYPVVAPGKQAWLVFALIAASTPVAVIGALFARPQPWQDWPWVAALIALVIPAFLWGAMLRRSVEFDGARLQIRGTLYTRDLALGELDLDHARVINLQEKPDVRPRWKTNGFSLPGYLAGNFRGYGGQRLFVLLTAQERVLMLPLHDGRLVLLSLESPHKLLQDLARTASPNL